RKIAHGFRTLGSHCRVADNIIIDPSSKVGHVLVKLYDEIDNIVLIAIFRPHIFTLLLAVTFDTAAAYAGNPAIQYIISVFGRDFQVDHHTRVLLSGIGIPLESTTRRGGKLGTYVVIGKFH